MLSQGGGPHAVLFVGAKGCGANDLARILAAGWMCLQPEDGMPCGTCLPCRTTLTGTNVDFQWVKASGRGGGIRLNKIVERPGDKDDDTIPILPFLRGRPLVAKRKVVVIEEAERLFADAANALLKTLEEPETHARLILTTSAVSRVLPTVLSRCLVQTCELPTHQEVEATLGRPLTEAEEIFGDGSPERIQQVAAKAEAYDRLLQFCTGLKSAPHAAAIKLAEELRAIAEALPADSSTLARAAHLEALTCLGLYLRQDKAFLPRTWSHISTFHRRISGNAQVTTQFEAMLARILLERDHQELQRTRSA